MSNERAKRPRLKVTKVTELYPSQACKNGGTLLPQTQQYFLMRKKAADSWIRISQDSYHDLPDRFEKMTEEQTKEVCLCPAGYHGVHCEMPMQMKCLVELTDPDTSMKGCEKTDSDAYLHSLDGFRPCFFYDFEQKYLWRYKLDCRSLNSNGLV